MSESLELQVQYAQQLLQSINLIVENGQTISNSFEQQIQISQNLNRSLTQFSDKYEKMSGNFFETAQKMQKAFSGNIIPEQAKIGKDIEKSSQNAVNQAESARTSSQQLADDTKKRTNLNNSQVSMSKKRDEATKNYSYNSKRWLITDAIFKTIDKKSKELIAGFNRLDIVKRAIGSKGITLLVDIPRLIITGLFKVVGSIIGLVSNFFKLSMALPFMVAEKAVEIGNAFRQDIIETIGNAYQSTKEYSDANSLIGKGISKIRATAVGALKTFENPRSLMVKMFGEGAAGAAAFLSEISKAIDDMGMVAETIGPQVTNSSESAEYLLVAMRTLGISSKDLSYYALDTSVNLGNIATTLDSVRATTEQAADEFGVDTKQVLVGFHKLRTNIKDFGHLSNQNLARTVAKMRQLNVGAEDLVSIFNKFTSFDDAAKTSAMLYQSFGMSIDALDLLTARNPEEIVNNFRDAMFATGRDYQDLNRHEKQLMQTTTGMNDAMLKSLMTYQNMGLSYEEARQKIANDNPTKKQIDAIKSLTSSVKEIQKVMTFKSPFEAFIKGLAKNGASSAKVRSVAMSLSKLYEDIYLFGLNLDKGMIQQITAPIIMIVQKVDNVFKSQSFKDTIYQATSITSNLIGFVTPQKFKSENRKKVDSILDVLKTTNTAMLDSDHVRRAKLREKTKLATKLMLANKDTAQLLKDKGIIDVLKDKNIPLEVALKHIREVSSEVKSKKGKALMDNIIDDLQENTFNIFGDIISSKQFEDNAGIRGQVKRTSDDMKKLFKEGGGLFGSIFRLGGKIMGSIIKGAAIAVSVFFNLLTSSLAETENPNSPMMKSLRNLGFDINKDFTILDWLGISKKDHEDLVSEIASAWTGFSWQSHKLFAAGSVVVKELYSMFSSLAVSLIGAFARVIVVGYDNLNAAQQAAVSALFGKQLTEFRDAAAMKGFGSGKRGVADLSITLTQRKKQAKEEEGFFGAGGYFGMIVGGEFIAGLEGSKKMMSELKKSLKGDLGEYFVKGNPYYDQYQETVELLDKVENDTYLDGDKRKFHYAMYALDAIKKYKALSELMSPSGVKSSLDGLKEKLYEEGKSKYKSPFTFRKQREALYGKLSKYRQDNKLDSNEEIHLRMKGVHSFGFFSEKIANSAYVKALERVNNRNNNSPSLSSSKYLGAIQAKIDKSAVKVKDGALTSILASNGLKLFTEDGKIIVPHTMDELINLSGDDKASLVNVFANIGSTYAQVSSAIVTINEIKKEKRKKASITQLVNKAIEVIEVYSEKIENSKVEFV